MRNPYASPSPTRHRGKAQRTRLVPTKSSDLALCCRQPANLRREESKACRSFLHQRIERRAKAFERHRRRRVILIAVLEHDLSLFGYGAIAAQRFAADVGIGEQAGG